MEKLFKLLRNYKSAEVWIKKPMNHPVSVPMVGRYCLVVFDDGTHGFWEYEQSDWANEAIKNVTHFYQL